MTRFDRAPMTPLRRRFIDDLRLRNYAPRTIEAYGAGVARVAKHFGRSPDQLSLEEIRRFQLHLLERKVSWSLSTRRSARCVFSSAPPCSPGFRAWRGRPAWGSRSRFTPFGIRSPRTCSELASIWSPCRRFSVFANDTAPPEIYTCAAITCNEHRVCWSCCPWRPL